MDSKKYLLYLYCSRKTNINFAVPFSVLGKAVGTLSKIGDELYVEPHSEGIYFRTVNANRSAFATFNFTQSFFSFYNLNATNADHTTVLNTSNRSTSIIENIEEAETTKCKVSMKVYILKINKT
jgi:cell cycle checkpoint control protein RAD9A